MSYLADPRVCEACLKRGAAPFQKCSVCEDAYYCSRDCQKRDWKNHKEHCKRVSTRISKIEELSMMDPLIPGCKKALAWYTQAFDFPVQIAVASALGMNTPEEKTRSHVAVVFLKWSGRSEDDISEQFAFGDIEVRPNADYLKLVDGFEADEAGLDYFRRPVSLETIPVNKGPWDDLWIKATYMIHVEWDMKKSIPSMVGRFASLCSLIHPRSAKNIVPSVRQLRPVPPIQPDWKELFAIDTSSPPLPVAEYHLLYLKRARRPTMANAAFRLERGMYQLETSDEVLDKEFAEHQRYGLAKDAESKIVRNKAKVPKMNPAAPRQEDPELEEDASAEYMMKFYSILLRGPQRKREA